MGNASAADLSARSVVASSLTAMLQSARCPLILPTPLPDYPRTYADPEVVRGAGAVPSGSGLLRRASGPKLWRT